MMLVAGAATLMQAGSAPRLQCGFVALFRGWRLVVLPVAWLAAERLLLADRFPETHALVDDWKMHLVGGFAFAFGYGLAKSAALWRTIARFWRPAGVTAPLAWAFVVTLNDLPDDVDAQGPMALIGWNLLRAVQAWGAIIGLLGLAQAYWNHDHRWRASLSEAVFPAHLIDQTIIIAVAFAMRPFGLSADRIWHFARHDGAGLPGFLPVGAACRLAVTLGRSGTATGVAE